MSEGARGQAPSLVTPRPALGVDAPRVPVQAFGPKRTRDVPPRHRQAPGTPTGAASVQPTRLVSPSGAGAHLSGPSGYRPVRHRVSPPYATAIHRGPHPVRPSRPEAPPLVGAYHATPALMTRQPCCGPTTPPTLRGSEARIGGPGFGGVTRGHVASHRGRVGPMYRPELCARPGVWARRPPLMCPSLQSPLGGWDLAVQPGFPDTPRPFVGLSAGPVGTGLGLPPDRRRDRGFPPPLSAPTA